MNTNDRTLEAVKTAIVKTLGIEDRAASLDASTALFGSLPELDSFAVVELLTTLQDEFGFEIDGSEFTAEALETVGSLAEFVASQTTSHQQTRLLAG